MGLNMFLIIAFDTYNCVRWGLQQSLPMWIFL